MNKYRIILSLMVNMIILTTLKGRPVTKTTYDNPLDIYRKRIIKNICNYTFTTDSINSREALAKYCLIKQIATKIVADQIEDILIEQIRKDLSIYNYKLTPIQFTCRGDSIPVLIHSCGQITSGLWEQQLYNGKDSKDFALHRITKKIWRKALPDNVTRQQATLKYFLIKRIVKQNIKDLKTKTIIKNLSLYADLPPIVSMDTFISNSNRGPKYFPKCLNSTAKDHSLTFPLDVD
jgi:hypothetical protein